MNKRQAKKKNKNQFDEYCRNYKELKRLKKHLARANTLNKFKPKINKEPINVNIEW